MRWFEEVWNQQRDETFHELCSRDFVSSMEGSEDVVTWDTFLPYRDALINAISDFHIEVEELIADGPNVVITWTVSGNHTGPGLGVTSSGRAVSFSGMSWMEFEDGMVVRGADRWNRGEVMLSLMAPRAREIQAEFGLIPRESQVAPIDLRPYPPAPIRCCRSGPSAFASDTVRCPS